MSERSERVESSERVEVSEKRQQIHSAFVKKYGSSISQLQQKHLKFLLDQYNTVFLNNAIKDNIKFQTKSVSPFMAAYTEYEPRTKQLHVVIDSYLLKNIDFATATVGGLKCNDQIECMQLLFEHELVHLLLYLNGETYQALGHNERFLSALKQLFEHNSYSTSIINSIIRRVDSSTTLHPNDQVWLVSTKNPSLEYMGVVVDVMPNDTYVVRSYTGEEFALPRKNILFYTRKNNKK